MFLIILTTLIIAYEVFVIINPQLVLDYVEKIKKIKTIEDFSSFTKEEVKLILFFTFAQLTYFVLLITFLFIGHVLAAIAILGISILNYALMEKIKLPYTTKDKRIDAIFCIIILLLTLL